MYLCFLWGSYIVVHRKRLLFHSYLMSPAGRYWDKADIALGRTSLVGTLMSGPISVCYLTNTFKLVLCGSLFWREPLVLAFVFFIKLLKPLGKVPNKIKNLPKPPDMYCFTQTWQFLGIRVLRDLTWNQFLIFFRVIILDDKIKKDTNGIQSDITLSH